MAGSTRGLRVATLFLIISTVGKMTSNLPTSVDLKKIDKNLHVLTFFNAPDSTKVVLFTLSSWLFTRVMILQAPDYFEPTFKWIISRKSSP